MFLKKLFEPQKRNRDIKSTSYQFDISFRVFGWFKGILYDKKIMTIGTVSIKIILKIESNKKKA